MFYNFYRGPYDSFFFLYEWMLIIFIEDAFTETSDLQEGPLTD